MGQGLPRPSNGQAPSRASGTTATPSPAGRPQGPRVWNHSRQRDHSRAVYYTIPRRRTMPFREPKGTVPLGAPAACGPTGQPSLVQTFNAFY